MPISNLIKVDNTWKLVDLPTESVLPLLALGPQGKAGDRPAGQQSGDAPSEVAQKYMDELGELDKFPEPTAEQIKRKCEILKGLAGEAKPGKDRSDWYRQLADVLSAAAQVGTYPDGVGG